MEELLARRGSDEIASGTITGSKVLLDGMRGKPSTVRWTLDNNPFQAARFPYMIEVAVLLRSTATAGHIGAFKAKINLRGELLANPLAGWWDEEHIMLDSTSAAVEPTPTWGFSPQNLQAVDLLDLVNHVSWKPSHANQARASEGGDNRTTILQIDEGASRDQKLFNCARGLYDDVWCKFRRFETLGLLSLHHYQDRLVQMEKKINEAKGEMSSADVTELATMLREYCEVLLWFEHGISQLT
jgi:hypothetical protein